MKPLSFAVVQPEEQRPDKLTWPGFVPSKPRNDTVRRAHVLHFDHRARFPG